MFKETSVGQYIKRTLILLLCLAIVLVLFYPLAMDTHQKRIIYLIVISSVFVVTIIAYWIYIFIREYRLSHTNKKKVSKKQDEQ